jgi:hypothetical protein
MWEPVSGFDGAVEADPNMKEMFATSSDIISLFKVQHEGEGEVPLKEEYDLRNP